MGHLRSDWKRSGVIFGGGAKKTSPNERVGGSGFGFRVDHQKFSTDSVDKSVNRNLRAALLCGVGWIDLFLTSSCNLLKFNW